MMRLCFLILVASVVVGAMLGRGPAPVAPGAPKVIEVRNDEARVAELKARNTTQFSSQEGSLELLRSPDGHFYADTRINGATVHMLIDTGATVIALSRDDAQMAGIPTAIGMDDVVGRGADGAVRGQMVQLGSVELGPLSAEGLDAIVLNSGQQSLLGQSFLRKFSSVEIEGDRMILR